MDACGGTARAKLSTMSNRAHQNLRELRSSLTGVLTIGFTAATANISGWLSFLIGLAGGAVTFYTGYRAALAVVHRMESKA
jgi:hypothetical protein